MSGYAEATFESPSMVTFNDSTLPEIITRPMMMPFNGLAHDNKAVYKRTISDTFQINCEQFFHVIDFTDAHGDPPTTPTTIDMTLPYKVKLLHQSALWVFYVKNGIAGDTVTFTCIDPEAGINLVDGPGASYTAVDYGHPVMLIVLVPGVNVTYNRYYIREINTGLPHVEVLGTGIATVTDAYPIYTVDVPDTTVVAGDRCVVTEIPDHTFTVDVDKTTVVAGDNCTVTEDPDETFTIDVDKTIVTAGDNCTVTEDPTHTFTIDCPTVTITSGGGCTITGSFPDFTVTVP